MHKKAGSKKRQEIESPKRQRNERNQLLYFYISKFFRNRNEIRRIREHMYPAKPAEMKLKYNCQSYEKV